MRKEIGGPHCGRTPLDNREMPIAKGDRTVDGGEVVTMGKDSVINSETIRLIDPAFSLQTDHFLT